MAGTFRFAHYFALCRPQITGICDAFPQTIAHDGSSCARQNTGHIQGSRHPDLKCEIVTIIAPIASITTVAGSGTGAGAGIGPLDKPCDKSTSIPWMSALLTALEWSRSPIVIRSESE